MIQTGLVIGMTASRKPPSEKQIAWLRQQIERAHELHHGACIGGDEAGHDAAIETDIVIVVHPPSNESKMMPRHKFAQRACIYVMPSKPYHDRNRDIVDAADEMIALPDGPRRPHSGTWYTVGYAEKMGKPVTLCYPDGTVERL
jgi:hypothetical protein